jgi:hypothetical protein
MSQERRYQDHEILEILDLAIGRASRAASPVP